MFKKSTPLSSTAKSRTNPFTPIRRFFVGLKLSKPIRALGKRVRAAEKPPAKNMLEQKRSRWIGYPLLGSISFAAATKAFKAPFVKDLMPQQNQHGRPRIALQQYDQTLDAIVITTLPSYPFCCHEDLLTMPRSRLVQAALLLNSRLPICSPIELADSIPDAHIRHSIERLVGIVPEIPGTPKPIKSRRIEKMDITEIDLLGNLKQDTLPTPPTSPLSTRVSRRRRKSLSVMSSLLERLEEEDENDSSQ